MGTGVPFTIQILLPRSGHLSNARDTSDFEMYSQSPWRT